MTSFKPTCILLSLFTFLLFITAPYTASCQNPDSQNNSFSLIIVGTRYFSDVDVIIKNLKNLPSIKSFTPRLESQKHLEYQGSFQGTEEGLLADIGNLAAERFTSEHRMDGRKGLIITLRKITTPSQTIPE